MYSSLFFTIQVPRDDVRLARQHVEGEGAYDTGTAKKRINDLRKKEAAEEAVSSKEAADVAQAAKLKVRYTIVIFPPCIKHACLVITSY